MMELPLIFVAGILGSAHCVGMCGGFAVAVGSRAANWRGNAARQALYTAGRIFTYATLGAMAGFFGSQLSREFPTLLALPAILSLIAGAILIYQGLLAAGWLPKSGVVGRTTCLAGSFLAKFLVGPRSLQVFLAGLFTGLLPCGLLYSMVTLAASTRSMLSAMAIMIVFGLGTAPAMMLAGWGGNLLRRSWRKPAFTLAAVCLILTGVLSVARGANLLLFPAAPTKACPLCAERA